MDTLISSCRNKQLTKMPICRNPNRPVKTIQFRCILKHFGVQPRPLVDAIGTIKHEEYWAVLSETSANVRLNHKKILF
jgi:hypothetical protein